MSCRRLRAESAKKVSSLILTCAYSSSAVFAQVNTTSQPPFQQSITITGQTEGPYNIRVNVKPQSQVVPMANMRSGKPAEPPKDKPESSYPPGTKIPPSQSPVNSGKLFPNLFGDESHHSESHHHGPGGSDGPFVGLDPYGPSPPLIGFKPTYQNPFLEALPPRMTDPDYACYNYAFEQLTGTPTYRMMNADDIRRLLTNFNSRWYKPGKDQLPEQYPPGTVLLFAGHVGIVGADGHTIFNYTMASKENNLPPTLHTDASANALWQTTHTAPPEAAPVQLPNQNIWDRFVGPEGDGPSKRGDNRPYANSPVQVYSPSE